MVILGLGSNVGDRLLNLRKALAAIKKLANVSVLQVSPVYWSNALLPENAPKDWDMPHLNLAIRCDCNLEPHDLLDKLKNIEWTIGRKPEIRHWGPRILDIDILAWDHDIIRSESLTIPHENLQDRPFALWPLADVAPFWQFPLPGENEGKTAAQIVEKWGSRFTGEAPLATRQIYQRIDTPQLIGIMNITPDSFSDGGRLQNLDAAIAHAKHLIETGAEILDLGAESTSPKAKAIDDQEEWSRLQPILQSIQEASKHFLLKPKISIDTRHVSIAEKVLEYGVDFINDVTGLDDIKMRELVRDTNVSCIFMHHLSIPEDRTNVLPRSENPVTLVYQWGRQRLDDLLNFGIKADKLIFDPGIGFGKMAEQSLAILQNVDEFEHLGIPVLIGHSRKTFMSLISKQSFAERDIETAAIATYLADKHVDYLRVHNVEMCARAIKAIRSICTLSS